MCLSPASLHRLAFTITCKCYIAQSALQPFVRLFKPTPETAMHLNLNPRRTIHSHLATELAQLLLTRLLLVACFLAASASNASETVEVYLIAHHHGDGDIHTHDLHAIEDDRAWATILILGSALAFGLAVFLCVRYY